VLHIVRWQGDPQAVLARIDALGYGLTLGVQTRIDSRALALAHRGAHRQMSASTATRSAQWLMLQPFGGEGLSGTGPRPAALVSLLRRADPHRQHHGGGGQCAVAGLRPSARSPKKTEWPRAACLAWYMAWSALASKAVRVWPSAGKRAMPRLLPTVTAPSGSGASALMTLCKRTANSPRPPPPSSLFAGTGHPGPRTRHHRGGLHVPATQGPLDASGHLHQNGMAGHRARGGR